MIYDYSCEQITFDPSDFGAACGRNNLNQSENHLNLEQQTFKQKEKFSFVAFSKLREIMLFIGKPNGRSKMISNLLHFQN